MIQTEVEFLLQTIMFSFILSIKMFFQRVTVERSKKVLTRDMQTIWKSCIGSAVVIINVVPGFRRIHGCVPALDGV